jgi:beta-N-acetylhexosaminidase
MCSTVTGRSRPAGRRRGRWWLVFALTMVAVTVASAVAGVRVLYRPSRAPAPAVAGSAPATTAAASPTPAARTPSAAASTARPALAARQLAGQRIIYSYPGLNPPASLFAHIRDGEAAGVIFFGENISSTSQIASVIRQLRAAQRRSPIHAPLLLMTDQEGGQVRRLPGAPVDSARQIGRSDDPPTTAARAGTAAAATLTTVGMNVNLAPVLDVYSAAGNFIDQYQRSYSSNAHTVATLGGDFLTAQQHAGPAATAKHFPGLGSAARNQNTDTGPVTLATSLSSLRGRDELPYSTAIAAGVELVMVSWAVYPALDATRPAGLSSRVVGSELRDRLHFHGVTITDALEAKALRAYGTTAQRAVLAARAGMDLILCAARDVAQGESATTALAGALTSGQLGVNAFHAAADRVTALRANLA